jgi:GTP cyclohydrolase II
MPDPALIRPPITDLPSVYGDFRAHAYDGEHLALVRGEVAGREAVLVRVHSECLTGDVLGSLRCDCGPQRDAALRMIGAQAHGVFLYLRQEGRGIGLANKMRAYALQDEGHDTFAANRLLGFADDERDFAVAATILRDLGVASVRLLTNNPAKVASLAAHGVAVLERLPLVMAVNPHNLAYLQAKERLAGHWLNGAAR